ncbi:hypothetical protein C8R46DRAFT_115580 [Mycena filopes]|nr:hypothetical protein C8R46DRAFT_115580 [Mycena filopes]
MHSNTSSVRSGPQGMDTQGSANARPQQSRRETHETTDPTYSAYPAPQTGPGWGSGHYGYPPPRATPWTPMPASGAYHIPQAPYSALSNPVLAPPPEPLFVAVNPFDASSPRWRRPGRQAPQNSVTSAEMPPSWPMQSPPPMHAFQPFALIPPVIQDSEGLYAGAVPARHSRSRSRGRSPTRIPHMVPESGHSRSPQPERFLDLYGVEGGSVTDSFVSASIAESRGDLHAHSPGPGRASSPKSEAHSSKSSSRAGRLCAGRSRSKSRSRTRSRSPSIHRRPTSRRADRNHSRSPRRSRSPRSHPPSVRRRPSSRDGRWGGRSQARPHHYPRSRSPPVRSTVEQGVGRHEAQHWHRHAYGGHGEFGQMQPAEIGHAAAYEAYRISIHTSSMYEPLSGDIERQRENLIGLAVAEASRLLQIANRSMDKNARTAASESAAATASILFYGSNPHRTFRVPSRGHSPQMVPVIALPSQIPYDSSSPVLRARKATGRREPPAQREG